MHPPGAHPAAPPGKRYELLDGWRFEVTPLVGARGRIIATDGKNFVDAFW